MNIAHFIHGLDLGGAQQIVKFIVRGADKQAFRHYVYSPTGGVFQEEIEKAGAVVRVIPRMLPRLAPLWVAALARAMRQDAVDVVHTHLFGDSLHGYLAARLVGSLPVVLTLHCVVEGHTRLQRLGYQWLLPRSTRNVACTESVARSWHAVYGGPIETISNGIEAQGPSPSDAEVCAEVKASLGIAAGTMVIGSVGRLVEQKGLYHLIRAFAQLCGSSRNHPRLVLVGDGPLRPGLQQEAERQGVKDLVLFTGVRRDVAELLRAFDVLVFSSGYEGLSIALLEGMAAARCIVATDAPGILDAVTPGQEAIIAPRGNVVGLTNALLQAIADAALRRRLGEAARKRFMQDFTAERMVEKYEAVYRDVHRPVAGLQMAATISQHRIRSTRQRSSV